MATPPPTAVQVAPPTLARHLAPHGRVPAPARVAPPLHILGWATGIARPRVPASSGGRVGSSRRIPGSGDASRDTTRVARSPRCIPQAHGPVPLTLPQPASHPTASHGAHRHYGTIQPADPPGIPPPASRLRRVAPRARVQVRPCLDPSGGLPSRALVQRGPWTGHGHGTEAAYRPHSNDHRQVASRHDHTFTYV